MTVSLLFFLLSYSSLFYCTSDYTIIALFNVCCTLLFSIHFKMLRCCSFYWLTVLVMYSPFTEPTLCCLFVVVDMVVFLFISPLLYIFSVFLFCTGLEINLFLFNLVATSHSEEHQHYTVLYVMDFILSIKQNI